ncbi:AAA family ATPase [Rhizobium sp. DKSPLA3]|uniref:AAA family ATPase n=1 Tax=Rhizobium quercicola TaxID=2901226 RepID=A0A9X1NUJ7_9HYPH|nr:AAA family ATPase [Rhizobium quercicola]MCD7110738.1 AAA family ATPase [Rhizobium quercicola]
MTMLIILSGLPGTGKTTLASRLCRHLHAFHIRIDTIEHILSSQGLTSADSTSGYAVAQAIAADNLRLGHIVVADCVNPVEASRAGWRSVAAHAGAAALDVALICSNTAVHRRRVETRQSDIVGLIKPSWEQIMTRSYDPWTTPPDLTLDTASEEPEKLARRLATHIQERRSPP